MRLFTSEHLYLFVVQKRMHNVECGSARTVHFIYI